MNYRPEIDGLRAIAVISVILFHADFESFRGGFVGVDVFFVISGFLITRIILEEHRAGKFSFVGFYERRARRLLPALFAVILFVCVASFLILRPFDLISLSKSVAAVSIFASNFYFWRDGGYFETASELKPLLHTWSLSVEEQFYLLFPLLIVFLLNFGVRRLVAVFVVLGALSLALAQWAVGARPNAAFFLLPTRGWELLLGSLGGIYMFYRRVPLLPPSVCHLLSCIGVTMILISVFTFSERTPSPSLYTLLPTFGTLLVLIFGIQASPLGRLLSSKALVFAGLVSYSAYLWHHPLFAFLRYLERELGAIEKLLAVILIFVLAAATWRYIELPFRAKEKYTRRFVFRFAIAGSVTFFTFGLAVAGTDFNHERFMARSLVTSSAIYASNVDERIFVKERVTHEDRLPEVVVLGSSRAMQIGSHIAGRSVLNLSVSGASIEDHIAIWHLVKEKIRPDQILIGGDPWLFNAKSGQQRWRSLEREFAKEADFLKIRLPTGYIKSQTGEPSLAANPISKFYRLVNYSRTIAPDDSPTLVDKVRRDGSRVYNIKYATKPQSQIDAGASSFLNYSMAEYEDSIFLREAFEKFVGSLSKRVNVVIVLSPFHPALYELMQEGDKRFLAIEDSYRDIAQEVGARVVGSFDPRKVSCGNQEFFDGMHPRDSCMRKVLSQLD